MGTRGLKSYRHYPIGLASTEHKGAKAQLYRVTTINWSFATSSKKSSRYNQQSKTGRWFDEKTVHKNVYLFRLPALIRFIRQTADCAEDIIQIEPEVS